MRMISGSLRLPKANEERVRFHRVEVLSLLFMLAAVALQAQPLQNRLMIATSPDGLVFTKLNLIAYDSADVPDAVVSATGEVFLYFQGIQSPAHDIIMVGRSPDGLDNWVFRPVRIAGMESWKVRPCDPDVIAHDGIFRLYFTGDPTDDKIPETYSAVSGDGIHFTLENGARFSGGGSPALDPSLLWIGDTLHYFAGGGGMNWNWHAVLTDGLNFDRRANFSVSEMMMSNGIPAGSGYRFYGFTNRPPQNIQSIYSADGEVWTKDPGIRLERDAQYPLEGNYVKDPAIVFKDSQYIMYYVTRKPEFSGVGEPDGSAPSGALLRIHPNPASASTTISFELRSSTRVYIAVYDLLGRERTRLVDAEMSAGEHEALFDASRLPGGMYFCRLRAEGVMEERRMVVVR
jgi:hypothetical protein